MRKLWLLFAQAVALTLAMLFVVSLVKPDWLAWRAQVVEVRESLPAPVLAPATASRLSFSDAARKALPSVVNISATRQVKRRNPLLDDPAFQRFFGERFNMPNETQLSLGSGVIVSREGYILTNDHVVDGVSEIHVTLSDGRTLVGKIVGTDPDTDLAVVRVSASGLTPITFGLSDQAQVGDIVLAIGDPFSVGQTVTMGIIGAVERGSPAEKSGMRLGDVIVAVNERPVSNSTATLNAIASVPPGKSVPVKVVRRNQELNLDIMVGKRRPRPRAQE